MVLSSDGPIALALAELRERLGRHGSVHDSDGLRAALGRNDLDAVEALLAASARRMLAANARLSPVTGRPFLVPAERTYSAQSWLWDLVFGAHIAHALSLRSCPGSINDEDGRLAFAQLASGCLWRTIEAQRGDGEEPGLIPHMVFNGGDDEALWGDRTASFITQPPVLAVGVRDLASPAEQAALFAPVKASLDWWLTHRVGDDGLPSIRHPWESGEDAARYHDSQLVDAIVVGLAVARGADPRALSDVVGFEVDRALDEGDLLALQTHNPSQKDPLAKRARFVLLAALRSVGGDTRAVSRVGRALYDVRAPSMAAHLVADLQAGAALADRLGHSDGERWRQAADAMVEAILVHQLADGAWPRALGRRPDAALLERAVALLGGAIDDSERAWLHAARDHVDAHGTIDVRAGTAAIVLGVLPVGHEAADRMLEVLGSSAFAPRFGLPTLARDDLAYRADDYWRGSTWTNIDWLTCHGLLRHARGLLAMDRTRARRFAAQARALARGSLSSAAEGFFEHYHADGQPFVGAAVDEEEPIHGRGCGPVDFTWSGLALLMVGQLREAEVLLR